jgi:hypothetical protein
MMSDCKLCGQNEWASVARDAEAAAVTQLSAESRLMTARIEELEGAIQEHKVIIHDKLQRVKSDYCPEDKKLWSILDKA